MHEEFISRGLTLTWYITKTVKKHSAGRVSLHAKRVWITKKYESLNGHNSSTKIIL